VEITTALLLCGSAQRLLATPGLMGNPEQRRQETDLASQPIDEARAGRPENTFVNDRLMFVTRCRTASRCSAGGRGLRTQQKAGPNLRSRGAEGECSGDSASVGDPPAAITGTLTVSAICGTKAIVRFAKRPARLRLQSRNMPHVHRLHSFEQSRHRHHAVQPARFFYRRRPTR